MANPSFTLRLAWENDRHSPDWELQTEHPGFSNWMAPALFVHRAASPWPATLELAAGRATLILDTGAGIQLLGDGIVSLSPATAREVDAGRMPDPRSLPGLANIRLSAWHFDGDGAELVLAACDAYQEVRHATPAHLSEAGLDGRWRPGSFEVLGPHGHVPVTVELDDSGQRLTVRVENQQLSDPPEEDTAAVSIILKP